MHLIQEEIESQAKTFSKLLNIEGKTLRMDSLMVSSSCKKLSRLEIIYTTVSRFIKVIDKLPERFKPYLDKSHHNDIIYRTRDKDLNSKIRKVLGDGLRFYYLYRKNRKIRNSKKFKLLARMLKYQTHKHGIKVSKEIAPNSLQNPTDPDATYRRKGKKKYIGYTANLIEKFDDKNRMIEGYDLQKNTYSDQKFAQGSIKKLKDTTLLTDGAYISEDINNKAKAKGIKTVPTNLVGGTKNNNSDKFAIDEKKHRLRKCPLGHKPITSKFKQGSYRAHFDKKYCNNYPFRKECPVIRQKKSYLFQVSEKTLHRCQLITEIQNFRISRVDQKKSRYRGYPLGTSQEV